MSNSLDTIHEFLGEKRIAMVGISHDPNDFSVHLFAELCRRGYDMVPVNPHLETASGGPCYARVQDVQPPVGAALLMTSPKVTQSVVQDCAEAKIRKIWMYRASGQGSVSQEAIDFCYDHGISVVSGECPFMFLPKAGLVHGMHGFIRKITGRYPN